MDRRCEATLRGRSVTLGRFELERERMPIATFRADLRLPDTALIIEAKAALTGPGIVILRHAVERKALGDARQAVENLCSLDASAAKRQGVRVGDGRYMVTLNLTPPFDRPEIFASPPLLAIARATLGVDVIINSLTVVIALPGAEAQRPHVDHRMLFPSDEAASMTAPPYALTAIVPLLDLSSTTGSTEVWPRGPLMATPDLWPSKLPGSTVLPLELGDAAIIDYRVCHGGTANLGQVPRPILYIVYSRPWFRDSENFSEIPPLRVTAHQLAGMPAQYRPLFASAAAGHLV
jgi:ectoine hydroxylase-related dioxygenase (phytanoyl-CoA dioxygenase family)